MRKNIARTRFLFTLAVLLVIGGTAGPLLFATSPSAAQGGGADFSCGTPPATISGWVQVGTIMEDSGCYPEDAACWTDWVKYNQAAIIQQLIEAMPKVAAAIAEPLSRTERIIVISGGGGDGGGAGASRITQDIANIIAQVPAAVEALTGGDLVETIRNLPGARHSSPAPDQAGLSGGFGRFDKPVQACYHKPG